MSTDQFEQYGDWPDEDELGPVGEVDADTRALVSAMSEIKMQDRFGLAEELTVGIDPGYSTGGLVMLNNVGDPVVGFEWKRSYSKTGGLTLRDIHGDRILSGVELPGVAARMVAECVDYRDRYTDRGCLVAIEKLFIGRDTETTLKLAESAGMLWNAFAFFSSREIQRIPFQTWTKEVLGVTGREAKGEAMRMAPRLWPGLGSLLDSDHACEAAAIAECARRRFARLDVRTGA